jgi:hypothetical protein
MFSSLFADSSDISHKVMCLHYTAFPFRRWYQVVLGAAKVFDILCISSLASAKCTSASTPRCSSSACFAGAERQRCSMPLNNRV